MIQKAKELTYNIFLVTFGVKPEFSETRFGYIEVNGINVLFFHEKPDKEATAEYIKKGNYYWNSGMFCFRIKVFLEELKKYAPEIYDLFFVAIENSKKQYCQDMVA